MTNLNRKQRRALAKRNKGSSNLDKAGNQITTALEALQKIQGLEGSVNMLEGIGEKIDMAKKATEKLAEDITALDFELKIQREVNLRLLSRLYTNVEFPEAKALAQLRDLEQGVRDSFVNDLLQETEAQQQASGEK